jgi:hypothetical protein
MNGKTFIVAKRTRFGLKLLKKEKKVKHASI